MARYSKKKVIKKKSVNKNKNKNTRVKKRRVSRGKSRRRVKRKYVGGLDGKVTNVVGKSTKKVKLNPNPETVLLAMFIFALLRLKKRDDLEKLFIKKSNKINNFIVALINLKRSLQNGGSNGPEISEPKPENRLLEHLQDEYKLRPRFPTTDPQTASLLAQFNIIPVSEESVTHIWEEITPDGDDNLLKYSTDELKKDELNHSKLNKKIAIDLAVSASKIQGVASLTPDQIKQLFGDIEVEQTDL